ncbi:MAG: carboxypeptidase-like regulatory domain-containing protein [Terracidiphilus sp.]|nr:carboxypeptidase-like regulatory domain-containing protein [Terracidiphilus sp.]MDR3776287.1 carboxypeptidase-like regulatory domain-containing protein [Terracidiphilus sp.]
MKPVYLRLFLLLLVGFLLVPLARAQDNATITGTVADASGALVPNAAITLTNPATSQTRQSVSNTAGIYRFVNVGVGNYSLSATATGFQKFVKTNIVVNVAQTLSEDVTLTVGSQAQTVTVQADALQVQTETNELSFLISGQQVTQLATNGRNVTALASLGMGKSNTLGDFGGVNALTAANTISFNGTRSSHNIYMLDGGELNDRGCGGCFSSLPSMDSLAEFQTLDSNYSATTVLVPVEPSLWSSSPVLITSTAACGSSTGMKITAPTTTSPSVPIAPGPSSV